MATGGNVVSATTPDEITVSGRVSSAGARVAPAAARGKWSVASSGTGVYEITFSEGYSEYLGCMVTLEAASGVHRIESFTAATRVLQIKTFAVDGTTATAIAFSFTARFSENRAP